jgi:hypothetical protein
MNRSMIEVKGVKRDMIANNLEPFDTSGGIA